MGNHWETILDRYCVPGRRSWVRLALPLAVLMLVIGCSSEPLRDNPADPGSSLYDPDGTLVITVRNKNGVAIQGSTILFLDQVQSVHTNSFGEAQLDLPPGLHSFTIQSPGYISIEDSAKVSFRERSTRSFQLNGRPQIDSLVITTLMQNDASSGSVAFDYFYLARALISDRDGIGDIESVQLYETGRDTLLLLERTPGPINWFSLQREFESELDTLNRVIANPLRVVVRDDYGDSTEAITSIQSFFFYKRLLEDMISGAQSASEPTFSWLNARKSPARSEIWFNTLRYRVEVYRGSASEPLYDTLTTYYYNGTAADPDTLRLTLNRSLIPGVDHYWRLTLYDPFDNAVGTRKSIFFPQ